MQTDIARARRAATRLLLSQSLKSLFIDVPQLRYDRQITFASMQQFCEQTRMTIGDLLQNGSSKDGCTIIRQQHSGRQYTVLYNGTISPRRTSFTLAHEIGHIYLEHQSDAAIQEQEADVFAAQLLLPTIFLYELSKRIDPSLLGGVVYETFNVSRYAAERSLYNLRRLILAPDFTPEDYALLRKYGSLLPSLNEPIVTM